MAAITLISIYRIDNPYCEHVCEAEEEEETEPTSGNFLVTNTGNFLITNTGEFLVAS